MIRKIINSQMWLSKEFDKLLPKKYTIDGNNDYITSLVPKYLKKDLIIYDIGGGKRPYLTLEQKKDLNATIVGLDICEEELIQAPEGVYNKIIVSDISKYQGSNEADLVICQALLEHVEDVESAFTAISSILKPGGLALIFVPSKNAVFARLNLILPQNIKKSILHTIYPSTKKTQGFPSFYNKCTPKEFKNLANSNGFTCIEERYYFISKYFTFFFPAHLLWRLWVLLFHFLFKEQAAETFSLVLKKKQ